MPSTNACRYCSGSWAATSCAAAGTVTPRRAESVATTTADPMTPPTWRLVLNAPAPAPAVRASSPDVARLDSGENVRPVPTPNSAIGHSSAYGDRSGSSTAASHSTAPAMAANPAATTHLAGTRSDSRPANGATTPDTSEPGIITRAALIGVRPRIDCRKIVSGKKMPIIANVTTIPSTFASEKLRDRNSRSGSSARGPWRCCHQTKAASTRTPRPTTDHTENGPQMWPQSKFSPSWSPKTTAASPSTDSTTPSGSIVVPCDGRCGSRATENHSAATPTGMLT